MSSPTFAADAYVQIGEHGILMRHENITMGECGKLGEEYAAKVVEKVLTPVQVICQPDAEDVALSPEIKPNAYVCYRTGGPIVCNDR